MNQDLRDRLRRLGVHRSAGPHAAGSTSHSLHDERFHDLEVESDQTPAPVAGLPLDLSVPLWNLELQTPAGRACVRRTQFPLDHQHGDYTLEHALSHPPHVLQRLERDAVHHTSGSSGPGSDLSTALFLDTETTGLAGGTGTLIFLVGVGYFDGQAFTVDQYFLPDPNEEPAMLSALQERLDRQGVLITFNGRGFDVPLLETRFMLARMPVTLADHTNLDLLMPARRAWRVQLPSCSLSSLEFHVLNVRRSQQDIPGFLIPQLYLDYLRTRNPDALQRVMYHNLHDVLSMVSLVTRLCRAISEPGSSGEYLSAGQHYESTGQFDAAVKAYQAALQADANPASPLSRRALSHLAYCLKRQERRGDAITYWQLLADAGDVQGWIELAMHYEWHAVDLERALECAHHALALARDPVTRGDISHRIERLKRKCT